MSKYTTKAIIAAISCMMALTGCAGGVAKEDEDSVIEVTAGSSKKTSSDNSKEADEGNDREMENDEDSGVSVEENNENSENNESNEDQAAQEEQDLSLYESFLQNKSKVHVDAINDIGYYADDDGAIREDCTLEELVNAVIATYINDDENAKISLESISYAFIDCGNDGKKELALCIKTPQNIEDWVEYFIIKDFDGQLRTVYSETAWSRSSVFINEYGYIMGDGSGGAADHYFEKNYVDADGKKHYLYSDSSTVGIGDPEYRSDMWFNGSSHSIPDDVVLDGDYVFLGFDFNGKPGEESYDVYTYGKMNDTANENWDDGFSGYFYWNLDPDEPIYSDDHPLKKFFDGEGLKVSTLKEVEQMIAEKEMEAGVTQEIKSGNVADWQVLSYDFEPDIPSLNSDNFLERKEYFPLSFLYTDPKGENTSLRINADGSIEGSYSDWNYNDADGSSVTYKNDFSGKFTLFEKISDSIYDLRLTEYAVANAVGTSETNEYTPGVVSMIYYIDVPGFDDGGSTFRLYCPGTNLAQISDKVYSQLPDYFKENSFENDILKEYVLFEQGGNNYVFRFFN